MAENIIGLKTKPMTEFQKAQVEKISKQIILPTAEEKAAEKFAKSQPVYQLDIAGQKYNPFTGVKEEKITTVVPAAPIKPTTGLTTGAKGTGGAVAPAFYANPQQVEAVGTAASLGAPTGTSGISTAVKKKGLFEQTGDWFSKLPADKQESALKAMTAAGFNLMQTGGTTYRTPISNAALLGQAGTVGLKTYEADQAAKAKAASEAAKLKFDQEYKTAKLGLTGGRGGGSAGKPDKSQDIVWNKIFPQKWSKTENEALNKGQTVSSGGAIFKRVDGKDLIFHPVLGVDPSHPQSWMDLEGFKKNSANYNYNIKNQNIYETGTDVGTKGHEIRQKLYQAIKLNPDKRDELLNKAKIQYGDQFVEGF